MTLDWPQVSRFATPEDSVGYLMWQVLHMWQRRAAEGLAAIGLTHMQFTLLAGVGWLARHGDAPTQAALAAHCQVDAMTVSQVVRKLEAKGLVTRTGHPADTRAKLLRLTEAGMAALTAALPEIEHMDDAFFAAADRERLTGELMTLYRAHRAGARPAEEAA
jgi:DNA-binding MarR family transcriptional regulator